MIYKVNVKNTVNKKDNSKRRPQEMDMHDVEGFATWFLHHAPSVKEMQTTFGYKADFNGVGLFVFKHNGVWRI